MADKYKNKYRIPSARLQNWDYGWSGVYFITICTARMRHIFGEIRNEKMILSNLGVLADVFWHEIKNHAKFVELDAFVVMPNHIHGILVLKKDFDYSKFDYRHSERRIEPDETPPDILDDNVESPGNDVDTGNDTCDDNPPSNTLPPPKLTPGQQRFQNQGKNTVSSIIGSYKSAVTKHAHRLGYEMAWQAKFWDNVIRTPDDYKRIFDYIINNPKNWGKDKFYGE